MITDELYEQDKQAYAKIAEAKFATEGTATYPDATFTLRLAFGPVKGYEQDGQQIPAWTNIGGAFEHEKVHEGQTDYVLPASWKKSADNLSKETPFNFVCTADIIGGNSGSPVVNRNGELVGLILMETFSLCPATLSTRTRRLALFPFTPAPFARRSKLFTVLSLL